MPLAEDAEEGTSVTIEDWSSGAWCYRFPDCILWEEDSGMGVSQVDLVIPSRSTPVEGQEVDGEVEFWTGMPQQG